MLAPQARSIDSVSQRVNVAKRGQLRPVLLADPSEFEFLLCHLYSVVFDSSIIECALRTLQHVHNMHIDDGIFD